MPSELEPAYRGLMNVPHNAFTPVPHDGRFTVAKDTLRDPLAHAVRLHPDLKEWEVYSQQRQDAERQILQAAQTQVQAPEVQMPSAEKPLVVTLDNVATVTSLFPRWRAHEGDIEFSDEDRQVA